jgi:hypothetical protein
VTRSRAVVLTARGWVFIGLGVTVATVGVAYMIAGTPAIMQTLASNRVLGGGALISVLGLGLYVSGRVQSFTESDRRYDARSALLYCIEWAQPVGPIVGIFRGRPRADVRGHGRDVRGARDVRLADRAEFW